MFAVRNTEDEPQLFFYVRQEARPESAWRSNSGLLSFSLLALNIAPWCVYVGAGF